MACTQNSPTVALSIASGVLRADAIVDPAVGLAPNALVANAAGLYVAGADGWLPLPAALAFSSASAPTYVATTSVDLTAFLGPGSKIKLTQAGTPRYFVVVAITSANVTLYGGDAQVLANSAVTLPFFGLRDMPVGFPDLPCSSLPATAFDGMRVSLIVDASNGVEWALKYKASEPTYKWRAAAGGPPLIAEVDAQQSTSSAGYTDLGTVGPTVIAPRGGDYDLVLSAGPLPDTGLGTVYSSVAVGGAGATDADAVFGGGYTGNAQNLVRARRKTGVAAGASIQMKYKLVGSPGPASVQMRRLEVRPVRLI